MNYDAEAANKSKEINRRPVLLLDPELRTMAQLGKYPIDETIIDTALWQLRDVSYRAHGSIAPEDREFLYKLARITWPDPLMAFRVDVDEEGTIVIMRPCINKDRNVFHKNLDLDTAMILIRYYIQRDLEAAKKSKFVSQATKDARRAFRELEARANAERRLK